MAEQGVPSSAIIGALREEADKDDRAAQREDHPKRRRILEQRALKARALAAKYSRLSYKESK